MDADMASPEDFMQHLREKQASSGVSEPNFLQAVEEVVHSVWPYLSNEPALLKANVLKRMVEPERVVMFRVTWVDDDGRVQVNQGWRVLFSTVRGPGKGGLRFRDNVSLDVLKFLGFEQTFKNCLTGLPLGGAKGGSDFSPRGRSDNEVMSFCQAFMSGLYKFIGPSEDVPAGDIGVGGREIGFLFGQYKRLRGEFSGVLTGKSLLFGGSNLRTEATGYGVVYFVEEMLKLKAGSASRRSSKSGSSPLAKKSVAVSGSGNVAQFCVEKAIQLGAKVVSMSDSSGTVHCPGGFSQEQLDFVKELKNVRRGRIGELAKAFPSGTSFIEGANPWGLKCDIAIPCATQNELDVADANKLVANGVTLVAEAANMPVTPAAVAVLLSKKVGVAPSKAANAGGVATSGFEMSQNAMRLSWTREEVDEKLKAVMKQIHATCVEYGSDDKGHVDYVKGANLGSFIKLANAVLQQGAV